MSKETRNYASAAKRLAGLLGVASASTLIGLPAMAELNPSPSIFREAPYGNQAPQGAPMPMDPPTGEMAPPPGEMTPPTDEAPVAPEAPMEAPPAPTIPAEPPIEAPAPADPADSLETPLPPAAPPEAPVGPPATPTDPTVPDGMEPPVEDPAATGDSIADIAAANENLTIFTAAIEAAGLTQAIAEQGPITVFAPTNEAFEALPAETLEALLLPENRETLIEILGYHVIAGEVTSDQLESGPVTTAAGTSLDVEVDATLNEVTINGASVVEADVSASNGVIHIIDQVLLPPISEPDL